MITAQILIQNNENTIEKCIKSLLKYNFIDIDVININSTDKTISICNDYKIDVKVVNNIKNYSEIRNNFLSKYKNKYCLLIQPYEHLLFNENFNNFNEDKYTFKCIQNTVFTKEVRLFNRTYKFKNPIFEFISLEDSVDTNFTIYSDLTNYKIYNSKEIINQWKELEPLNFDPYYYECFIALSENDFLKFKNLCEYCLSINKKDKTSLLLRYYLSMINLHCFNDINNANSNILNCISQKPEMSEFWCLLGDIFYKIKDFSRAKEFYENAIIIGKKRKFDELPLDISKYKEYPEKMINIINPIH